MNRDVSVIVTTYNARDNGAPLLERDAACRAKENNTVSPPGATFRRGCEFPRALRQEIA